MSGTVPRRRWKWRGVPAGPIIKAAAPDISMTLTLPEVSADDMFIAVTRNPQERAGLRLHSPGKEL